MIATYQRTIFEKGDFSICSFKPEDENEPPQNAMKYGTFVGVGINIPHSEDVKLNLDGDWESNKYGLQMKINTCISILPKTEEGIIAFLSSGVLPYIKNKTAIKLYKTFGDQVFSVIENHPEELLRVSGITKKKLKAIQDAYTVNYGYQDLLMLLQPAGISVSKIKKIVDRFGASASEKIKNNAYILFTINGYAYLAYNYDNESFAAGRVRAFLCIREKPVRVDPYIADFERSNFPLAEKQREAIQQFFSNRFSIITGGPGTGKSTVL